MSKTEKKLLLWKKYCFPTDWDPVPDLKHILFPIPDIIRKGIRGLWSTFQNIGRHNNKKSVQMLTELWFSVQPGELTRNTQNKTLIEQGKSRPVAYNLNITIIVRTSRLNPQCHTLLGEASSMRREWENIACFQSFRAFLNEGVMCNRFYSPSGDLQGFACSI